MASVFKRSGENGKKVRCWTIQYVDAQGKKRQRIAFTDKQESLRLANKLEHEALLRRSGLIDTAAEERVAQAKRPISIHLDDFLNSVRFNMPTEKHVTLIKTRIEAVIEEADVATPSDFTLDGVESAIMAIQKKKDLGLKTVNHYIQAVKGFLAWMVPKRLPANPLLDLKMRNAEVDVRKKRRALTVDEFSRLLSSARSSAKDIQCFNGEQRARIYLISYLTGLRRKEIASLTPESFQIDGDPPTMVVEAGDSKHRRKDTIPLHPELVEMLRDWMPEYPEGQPLFPKLAKRRTWLMIKKDLEAAGIPYKTKDGDADFHAAGRHSHITELLLNGASLVEAKELARHKDVRMTMRYTHIGLEDQAKAIKKLPANSSWRTGLPDVEAAGTNDKSQHIRSKSQHIRSKSGVSEGHSQSLSDTESHSSASTAVDVSACCSSPSDTRGQKKAPPVTGDALTEDTGVEPATHCWAIDFESTC